jgi:hypothetical protein
MPVTRGQDLNLRPSKSVSRWPGFPQDGNGQALSIDDKTESVLAKGPWKETVAEEETTMVDEPAGLIAQIKEILREPRLLRIFAIAAIVAFTACAFLIKLIGN